MKSLIPWEGTENWLDSFRHEMDETMQRFFHPVAEARGLVPRTWVPRVDVEETDKAIVVKADLPGVNPNEVEITVANGCLVLRGERKEAKEEKGKTFNRVERFAGKYYRSIDLPPGVDAEKITAESANGVITVTIPKAPEVQPKKIAVKANGK
jgi:HSP20 family protein